jgi:hypothetical protein
LANELQAAQVRLSSKEVPGLGVRVLGTALMPWGASAGAAEAIEFGELSGAGRYRALAAQLEDFDTSMWRAPAFIVERETYALCDAHGGSALFFGAALADWLDAWLEQTETVAVGLRNVRHIHDLHVLPYWLARRGRAALVLSETDAQETPGVLSSAARGDGDAGWYYAAWQGLSAVPVTPLNVLSALAGEVPAAPMWHALQQAGAQWLGGGELAAEIDGAMYSRADRPDGANVVVVATRRGACSDFAVGKPARSLDAARFAGLRVQAMREGWPMPREQWERLMRFADRSLIRTSERSREGAG